MNRCCSLSCAARAGSRLSAPIAAHETRYQHREEKLASDCFDNCKPACNVRTRYDVTVTERRQSNKTEVESTDAAELSPSGEVSRSGLLDNPVEQAEENSG